MSVQKFSFAKFAPASLSSQLETKPQLIYQSTQHLKRVHKGKSNFDSWLKEIPGKGRNYARPPNNQTPIHCIWKLFCHHFTAPAEVVHGPFEALAVFKGYYSKRFNTGNCMKLAITELECSEGNVTLKSFSSVHFLFKRNRKQMEQGGPTCHRRTPQALASTLLPKTNRGVTKSS